MDRFSTSLQSTRISEGPTIHDTKVDPRKRDDKRVEDGEHDNDHHDQDVIGEPNYQVEPSEYQHFTEEGRDDAQ